MENRCSFKRKRRREKVLWISFAWGHDASAWFKQSNQLVSYMELQYMYIEIRFIVVQMNGKRNLIFWLFVACILHITCRMSKLLELRKQKKYCSSVPVMTDHHRKLLQANHFWKWNFWRDENMHKVFRFHIKLHVCIERKDL